MTPGPSTESILPVVLAGGAGTRLWPLSREQHPKQFLPLAGRQSLLQQTLQRLRGLNAHPPCIVCNETHRFLVAEQCREAGEPWGAILLECEPRSTAPAICLAACHAMRHGDDPMLLAVPSDGHIAAPQPFLDAVAAGLAAAEAGRLVTFGVRPDSPHTGYGYIRAGEALHGAARRVVAFEEKPPRAVARRHVASGEHYWNTGIFLFRASVIVAALRRHSPDIVACCEAALAQGEADLHFFRPGPAFAQAPAISIDHAVMEKTGAAAVVPVAMQWSDLGSWSALHEAGAADDANNAIAGDVIAVDAKNSLIHATGRLVAAVGIDNLIVAETPDAVLVAQRDAAQSIRQVVSRLQSLSRPERLAHRRVHRPWGWFENLDAGPGYRVKRITVNVGAQLSMQTHRHRSEHWVVVRGAAEVTRGAEALALAPNQSTYIAPGMRHRLSNAGQTPLEVIEVQVGDYLGEDDIERIKDDFGRSAVTTAAANGDDAAPA